jgi:uncharacterized membrane protein
MCVNQTHSYLPVNSVYCYNLTPVSPSIWHIFETQSLYMHYARSHSVIHNCCNLRTSSVPTVCSITELPFYNLTCIINSTCMRVYHPHSYLPVNSVYCYNLTPVSPSIWHILDTQFPYAVCQKSLGNPQRVIWELVQCPLRVGSQRLHSTISRVL